MHSLTRGKRAIISRDLKTFVSISLQEDERDIYGFSRAIISIILEDRYFFLPRSKSMGVHCITDTLENIIIMMNGVQIEIANCERQSRQRLTSDSENKQGMQNFKYLTTSTPRLHQIQNLGRSYRWTGRDYRGC